MREQLGSGVRRLWELLFQHRDNAGVELLAAGFEQRAVGSVLDQGVLEGVGRVGLGAAAEHKLG